MAHCKNDKLQHAVSVNKQICLHIPASHRCSSWQRQSIPGTCGRHQESS